MKEALAECFTAQDSSLSFAVCGAQWCGKTGAS
jgi:hypothetical protein